MTTAQHDQYISVIIVSSSYVRLLPLNLDLLLISLIKIALQKRRSFNISWSIAKRIDVISFCDSQVPTFPTLSPPPLLTHSARRIVDSFPVGKSVFSTGGRNQKVFDGFRHCFGPFRVGNREENCEERDHRVKERLTLLCCVNVSQD